MTDPTEKQKPADVQAGQILFVRKDNLLPDSHPALMLHPRYLIETGQLPADHGDHLVIQINEKHFDHFARAALEANLTMSRISEDSTKTLYRLEKSNILIGDFRK